MILKILQQFLNVLMRNRQCGHTTLIEKLAKENDVYVLVHNQRMRDVFDKEIHHKLFTLRQLDKLSTLEPKPILIDNAALHVLLTDSILKIGTQEEIIAHQKHVLSTLRDVLTIGGQMNPHTGHKIRITEPPKRIYQISNDSDATKRKIDY